MKRTWVVAILLVVALSACGGGTRNASAEDTAKAQATCTAKGGSPTLSAPMKADLDRRCAADAEKCRRFQGAVAGVCAYQDKVAKIPLSTHVEVYATIGKNDDLALDDLCRAMRGTAGVSFLQDLDIWIARGGDPYWGKGWRRRCAQGSGEHR